MGNKNAATAVKVTHIEMICWAINYQETQRESFAEKATKMHESGSFEVERYLRKEVNRIESIIGVLRDLYKIETGNEYF
jgi:hypothetical protein